MRIMTKIGVLLAMASLAGPLQAAAESAVPASARGDAVRIAQSGCLSLRDAIDRVRRQYNGRIVDARTIRRGDREVHLIKVLTGNGTVKTVRVPGCGSGSRG